MAEEKIRFKELTEKDKKLLKKYGWKSLDTQTGYAWFGGKTHHPIADHLPEKTLEKHNFEDLDFLVVGWRVCYE